MSAKHTRLSLILATTAAAGATLAAPATAKPGPTLDLTLGPTTPQFIDIGPPGKSPGDRYAINTPLRDRSGTEVGMFRAAQWSLALEGGAEVVQTEGVFDLADGAIVFAGTATSPVEGLGLTVGPPFTRAVIGGTGSYAGASGTVVTTRRADGTYDQQLRLVLPDGQPQTLTVPGVEGPPEQRVDLDPPGTGPGDVIAVWGGVAGQPGATVRGTQSVLAADGPALQVLSSLTFGLPAGDLTVAGLSTIPQDGTTLTADRRVARAVTGGTRRFRGRGGTQTVVRRADGTYANALELWAPRGRAVVSRVRAKRTASTKVDVGAPGPSVGDVEVFRERLIGRGGRSAGRVDGTRTTVAVQNGRVTVETLLTMRLPGGTVVAGGVPSGRTLPVMGGTGRYAGMRGDLRVTPRRAGTTRDRLRLRRVG